MRFAERTRRNDLKPGTRATSGPGSVRRCPPLEDGIQFNHGRSAAGVVQGGGLARPAGPRGVAPKSARPGGASTGIVRRASAWNERSPGGAWANVSASRARRTRNRSAKPPGRPRPAIARRDRLGNAATAQGALAARAARATRRLEPASAADVRRHRRAVVGGGRRCSRSPRTCCRARGACSRASSPTRRMLWTHSQVTLTEILLGFGLTVVTAIPLGLLIALSPLVEAGRLSADHADAARAEDRRRAAVPRVARLRHRVEGAADGADDVLPAAAREHQRLPDPRRPPAVPHEVDGRDAAGRRSATCAFPPRCR